MLKQKKIKLPQDIKVQFLIINGQRFIVFTNTGSAVSMAVNIPLSINLLKEENLLVLSKKNMIANTKEDTFYTYLKNFIINFKTPAKKIIVLRGLGLKASLGDNNLSLKLGYSHDSIIKFDSKGSNKIFVSKKFICISSYNKLSIGNFSEKIYRLKKANCYKGRGLYLKDKKIITKVVKKS